MSSGRRVDRPVRRRRRRQAGARACAACCRPSGCLVVVNTGDDFEHLGLHISPDIDTVTYTLAGLDKPSSGWGRRDETWTFMETHRARWAAPTWFRLGDGDLAMHVERTRRLRAGETLSQVTRRHLAGASASARASCR